MKNTEVLKLVCEYKEILKREEKIIWYINRVEIDQNNDKDKFDISQTMHFTSNSTISTLKVCPYKRPSNVSYNCKYRGIIKTVLVIENNG